MPEAFIPVAAPVHTRRLSRLEIALAARRNVLEIIPAISYSRPIVTGEALRRWHMLTDPAGYKRVMLDNLSNYPKSEIMRRMLRPAIGESLFNADGAEWKWQRQAVAPVFTHRNVVALAPAMSATAARASTGTISRWPPLLVPWPPGSCTECVASNTTGAPVSRMMAKDRMSLTRLL